jgi:tape measure domain-containing protein
MAALEFDVRLHYEQLSKDVQAINNKIDSFVKNTKEGASQIDDTFKKMGGMIAGYFTLAFAGNMVKQIAMVRGEFQQLEVAFRTMLGNKILADQLMSDVVEFAAITPFELKEVASGAKSLLAFGVAAKDILPTLKSLGDVSAGLSVPIERLILNFGQVKTQAQLTGRELRDFNIAGVPLISELAKNLGVAEEKISEMVSAGNIGFEDVAKAFQTMTQEGGRFANLMSEQSKTITGQVSNLKDAWNQMLNEIGKSNEGAIGGALGTAKLLIENYEKVIDVLKVIVATYGAYKAAVIMVSIAEKARAIEEMVILYTKLRKELTMVAAAQQAFNLASKANPYGLILAAITAVVGSLLLFSKKHDEAADSMAEFQVQLNNETRTLDLLFGKIKDTNEGTQDRKKAIKTVNETYGSYLKNLLSEKSSLEEIEKAQRDATAALRENMAVKIQEAQLKPYQDSVDSAFTDYTSKFEQFSQKLTETQRGAFRGMLDNYVTEIESNISKLGYYPGYGQIVSQVKNLYGQASGKGITGISNDEIAQLEELGKSITFLTARQGELGDATKSVSKEWEVYGGIIKKTTEEDATKSLDTVSKQIENTQKLYSEASKKLADMRKSASLSTPEEISAQEQSVNDLKKQLETLTGVSQKEKNKLIKQDEERIKAKQELSDRLIELENQTQAAQIAIMQEGSDKMIREADLQLSMEIQAIEKAKAEMLSALLNQGYSVDSPEYVSTVSKYDTLEQTATQKNANTKIKIEQDAAEKIKAIRQEVTDSYLSNQRYEEEETIRKWDKIISEMQSTGKMTDDDYAAAEQAKIDNLLEIRRNYAMEQIDFEEELANIRASISEKYMADQILAEKNRLERERQFIKKRAELLKGTKEGEIWEQKLQENQEEIENLTTEWIKNIFTGINEIDAELGKTLSNMMQLVNSSRSLAENLKAGGSALGAISSVVGIVGVVLNQLRTFEAQQQESIANLFEIQNRAIEEQIDLLNDLYGTDRTKKEQDTIAMLNEQIAMYEKMAQETKLIAQKKYNVDPFGIIKAWSTVGRKSFDDVQQMIDFLQSNETIEALASGKYRIKNFDEIDAIVQGYLEAKKKIEELTESELDFRLGFDVSGVADDIAQGIDEGLKLSEGGLGDWTDNFGDLLKRSLMSVLKATIEKDFLNNFMSAFDAYMKDDSRISTTEASDLAQIYEAAIVESQALWDSLSPVLDKYKIIGDTDNNKLTGAIKGITEEQAGIISGQFFAMRENQVEMLRYVRKWGDEDSLALSMSLTRLVSSGDNIFMRGTEQLDIANQSYTQLVSIEKNTRDIALLTQTNAKLDTMNAYLKQLI